MVRLTGAWDRDRTEAFLAEATVPIRLACHSTGGRLWMLSLWFEYRDDRLHCATSAHADVVDYLEGDDEVAFEVSTNEPPYKGVRGNGTASLSIDENKRQLRSLIDRYLGDRESSLAQRLLSGEREEVHIEIDPRRVYTWDFTDRMADVEPDTSG